MMGTDESATPGRWRKTALGYVIVEPRWGATVTFNTKKNMTEEELNQLLEIFYANAETPLQRDGVYGIAEVE